MKEKQPYFGKNMSIYIEGLSYRIGFVEFSHAVINWWENPRISHVTQSTVGWKFDGRELTILWE